MRTKIIQNIWIPDNFKNPWVGMTWRNANHDSDRDGIPNYLDADPLNAKTGTWGMSIQRRIR